MKKQREIRDYWNVEDPYEEYLDYETKAEVREKRRGEGKMRVSGKSVQTIVRTQRRRAERIKGNSE